MSESAREPILLDTHVWIWLLGGGSKSITPPVQRELDVAALQGRLALSAISVWELGMLDSKGRVKLHLPCEQWVEQALSMPGLSLIPLSPRIALESTRLPGNLHGDPSDRIIAATARCTGARLLTYDQLLREYGKAGHLRLL